MSRTIGGTSVSYTWDLNSALPEVLEDEQGNRYVYGLDLISRTNGSSPEYSLADGLGSTTGLTDDTGALTDTYSYDAFGGVRSQTGSSSNEFTYTGEQNDPTGLDYLRARYYDPATGRFLSQDPLPIGNLYSYVGNNPVNLVDPYGLCGFDSWRDAGDCIEDFGECAANGFDCTDVRRLIDLLIPLIPEGRLPFVTWHLSYQLLANCGLYPEACAAGIYATKKTRDWSKTYYGAADPPEGSIDKPKEGDAFSHCYWSGLITLMVGADKAEGVTSRFEAYGSRNPSGQREFDMDNNRLGREYAQGAKFLKGPGAESALRGYCREVGAAYR